MNQMECYYEALIQELEENQKQMLGELHNLINEHSTCLCTLSSSKDQMEAMHQEMNEQILRFDEDRRNLDALNKELKKRAITSEVALKRARLNYSIVVDHLQKDLELLSFQVLSMFETNEVEESFFRSFTTMFSSVPENDAEAEPVLPGYICFQTLALSELRPWHKERTFGGRCAFGGHEKITPPAEGTLPED